MIVGPSASSCWAVASLLGFLSLLPLRAETATPLLPLSAIQPGMKGEWRTVVSGTRIVSFPMEVVGIAQNFIGPQRPVIICKGLDATNILTGPVAGMSGSPVYIGGKLIGAYAYGFLYPKHQDIFGVTPIGQMLEVENHYPPMASLTNALTGTDAGGGAPQWLAGPPAQADLPSLDALQSAMRPLPTPLFVSGISERTLARFRPQLEALGLHVMEAPSGRVNHPINTRLEPGSAVSGVLMSGDFDFAGTGTVTWRQGNRILAFGHPFLQSGPTDMPLAPAQIITVIQSSQRSFKLPNIGPIVGTIYQDRLTAIAGEIGRKPQTTHVVVHLAAPGDRTRLFQGQLFQNQMLSPTLAAMALQESISDTMEAEREQTIYLRTTLDVAGHKPVQLRDVATGPAGSFALSLRQLSMYQSLLNNPCQFPDVKSLVFHVRLVNRRQSSQLDSLEMDRNAVRPGAALQVVLSLRHYRGGLSAIPLTVPIPPDLAPGQAELFVGDADAAMQMDQLPTLPPRTLGQVLARLRRFRSHGTISVKLLQKAPGVSVAGQNLPDLPPSVLAQFQSPNTTFQQAALSRITLWETNFPVAGTFSGHMTLPVRIK